MISGLDQSDWMTSDSQILAKIPVNLTSQTGPPPLIVSWISRSGRDAIFRLFVAFSTSIKVGELTLRFHSACL